jgi:hypothetical protein
VTYRWTVPPTNAVLVPEEGLDEPLEIHDLESGLVRTQVWHYPSRGECLQCHTPAAGWVLGFNTRQLNRLVETGGFPAHQLATLSVAGYFQDSLPQFFSLPALAPATNELASVEWRVRSWLDVNCAQCHRPGGTALGAWDARASTPLSETGLIHGLLNNNEGDPANRVVAPGSVEHTMIHARITRLGSGRMPPLASTVIDGNSAALLRRWITNSLADWQSYASWQTNHFASTEAPEAAREADPDEDGGDNWLEYLTRTDPQQAASAWVPGIARTTEGIRLTYEHLANRGFVVEWTDSLLAPVAWYPLEVQENQFFLAAEDFSAELRQPAAEVVRFYRVRVFEP